MKGAAVISVIWIEKRRKRFVSLVVGRWSLEKRRRRFFCDVRRLTFDVCVLGGKVGSCFTLVRRREGGETGESNDSVRTAHPTTLRHRGHWALGIGHWAAPTALINKSAAKQRIPKILNSQFSILNSLSLSLSMEKLYA